MCAYRGLRNWPGSKSWFPLFICGSGLLKVKFTVSPQLWPLPGGFEWRHPWCRQSFTSLHKSLPEREIPKVHFELSAWGLPVICHGQRVISGTQRWRRAERGRVCLSNRIILLARVSIGDTSGLHSQLSDTEKRSFGVAFITWVLRKLEKMDNSSCCQ